MSGIPELFAEYLKNNPNKKHMSTEEKWRVVGWLSDSSAKPSCQKDYSRRNYAQRTYRWDANRQKLLTMAKNDKDHDRIVVTLDEILRVVEEVHITDHAGWDATWNRVSKKYSGIVRSDVIWLITKCGMCKVDPRKRSRGSQESQESQENQENQALAPAPAPVPSLPIAPLEAAFGYYNNNIISDNTMFQLPEHQNVFQDVHLDGYQNTYPDMFQDDYQDIFQDSYPDISENSFPDLPSGGFQDVFQGGFQDVAWQGDLTNIDPSLLAFDGSLYANYSQGESSGTNNYTYGNESGQ
ncbi:hypothetical protein V8C35DRAFT_282270 [Trichoderma chlorosporum]